MFLSIAHIFFSRHDHLLAVVWGDEDWCLCECQHQRSRRCSWRRLRQVAHRLWWMNFAGVAGKAALCDILIVSGSSCPQWALGNLSDTIYPKFNPQHIDVCLFFVLCPAKVWRSCEDSPCEFSTGGCSYIKMLYSCVCSVATGYYFTKLPKKTLPWQEFLWHLGWKVYTKIRNSQEETALLFKTKDKQEIAGSW